MNSKYHFQSDRLVSVSGVKFGILSPERTKEISACEIYRHFTGTLKDQPGTHSDTRLGVIERGKICQTCLQDYVECPGHMGYINLAKPVFNPQYVNTIIKILMNICFRCSRLKINRNIDEEYLKQKINKIRKKHPKNRLIALKSMIIDSKSGNRTCSYCNALLPSAIRRDNQLSKLLVCYKDKDVSKTEIERKVNAEMVLAIFKSIPNEDIELLGFDPNYSRPEWMIITVLPFPPTTVRPPTKLDIGRMGEDDLSIKLNEILKSNNNLRTKIQQLDNKDIQKIKDIDFLWELLQFHITTYIDNESNKNGKTSTHRSGRPLKTLVQRIKAKEGRVRGNLMGKRVNDSGRTVITPDNQIGLDEIGVPKKIAINLIKPEIVSKINIDRLQQMVYNGMSKYPGAKYIITFKSKYKKILKLMSDNDRKNIKLSYGDIVCRNIIDGDWVFVNRQPSLHRMSMMGHRVVILPGETFRLNVQSVTPYNADFDGDEMNIHVPQNIESENELARLACLANQIISPKNALPIIGLVQDSVLGIYMYTKFGHTNVVNTMKMLNNLDVLSKSIDYQTVGNAIDSNYKSLLTSSRNIINMILPKVTMTSNKNKDIVKYGILQQNNIIDPEFLKIEKRGLFYTTWNDYNPHVTKKLFDNLARIATDWLLICGFTVGIRDCIPNLYVVNRKNRIVEVYEHATKYLVDYQQLNNIPNIKYESNDDLEDEPENISRYLELVNLLTSEVKSNHYTYNNKMKIEKLMTAIYYNIVLSNAIYELNCLNEAECFKFDVRYKTLNLFILLKEIKNKIMILIKFEIEFEYAILYTSLLQILDDLLDETNQSNVKNITDNEQLYQTIEDIIARIQYNLTDTIVYINNNTVSESDKTSNFDKWYKLFKTNFPNMSDMNDMKLNIEKYVKSGLDKISKPILLGNDSCRQISQQVEACCLFISTLLYLNTSAPDLEDRVEMKLYDLVLTATSIVNDIIIENIAYFQYNGYEKFNYSDNSFKTMYHAKSKGDAIKIGQIAGLLGQQDLEGKRQGNYYYRRSLPHYPKNSIEPKARGYVQNSYLEGLTMLEYFSHAQSGRIGQIDKTIKTAETGYIQRKLIKVAEGLVVHYDGTVRNSSNNVIQKLYGCDGIDSQCTEIIQLNLSDIDKYINYTTDELDKIKSRLVGIDELKIEIISNHYEKINALNKFVHDHYDSDITNKELYITSPINFSRLVKNNYYRFKLEEKKLNPDFKSNLNPVYVLSKINQFIDNVKSTFTSCNESQKYDNYNTILLEICINIELSPKKLINDYCFDQKSFDCLIEDIYSKYYKSVVAPGESVGIVSAQSIGEPLTQTTLNKFHAAGVGKASSRLNSGLSRLSEIFGLTKKSKMKTPSMNMEISKSFMDEISSQHLGSANIDVSIINCFQSFKFRKIINESYIYYDPNNKLPWSNVKLNASDKITICDNLFKLDTTDVQIEMPWVIYFTLKPIMKRELRSDILKFMIENCIFSYFKNKTKHNTKTSRSKPLDVRSISSKFKVYVSYDGMIVNDKIVSYAMVRFSSSLCGVSTANINIMNYMKDIENELINLNIKGISGIDEVFIEKEGSKHVLLTLGSDINEIIMNPTLSSIIKINTLNSNDLLEIEKLYGIEAARECFIREIYYTLKSDLSVRHIELLADNISYLGSLLSVNRHGVNRGNNGPLHRASFEETTTQFINSSMYVEVDPMIGPSSNVMFGQFIKSGTNFFEIRIDHEKLKKLESSVDNSNQIITPFNFDGVGKINIPTQSSVTFNNTNLIDLFVYKFAITQFKHNTELNIINEIS